MDMILLFKYGFDFAGRFITELIDNRYSLDDILIIINSPEEEIRDITVLKIIKDLKQDENLW